MLALFVGGTLPLVIASLESLSLPWNRDRFSGIDYRFFGMRRRAASGSTQTEIGDGGSSSPSA
jgi:hypothetical protein